MNTCSIKYSKYGSLKNLYAVVFLFLYFTAEISLVTKLRNVDLVNVGFVGNSVVFFANDLIWSLVWVTNKTGFGLDDWIY
jgi:hypothetical protein